jgi:hypothetical protein
MSWTWLAASFPEIQMLHRCLAPSFHQLAIVGSLVRFWPFSMRPLFASGIPMALGSCSRPSTPVDAAGASRFLLSYRVAAAVAVPPRLLKEMPAFPLCPT